LLFGYRFVDASYWTLPIELCFYAAMAVVMLAGAIRYLQAVVTVWIVLQVVCAPFFPRIPLLGLDYYFLAAGAVLALLYQRRNERFNYALLAISLLLCIRCVFVVGRQAHFDPWIGTLLILAAFGTFLWMRGKHVELPWARRIGSLTYALYLLHFHVGLTFMFWWVNESNKWVLLACVTLFLIGLAAVLDDLIEFRLRRSWVKLFGATVARPIAWCERRNKRGI
jgi:peptidoglycan/LPS O-acetylase OafA/YrhL